MNRGQRHFPKPLCGIIGGKSIIIQRFSAEVREGLVIDGEASLEANVMLVEAQQGLDYKEWRVQSK